MNLSRSYQDLILRTWHEMAREGNCVPSREAICRRIEEQHKIYFNVDDVAEAIEPSKPTDVPASEGTIPVRAYRRARILGGVKKPKKTADKERDVPAIVVELRKHIEATERKLTAYRDALDAAESEHGIAGPS